MGYLAWRGQFYGRDPGRGPADPSDARGNRHHQGLFIQAGGDLAQHFDHDVRLNGAKDDISHLGDFLRAFSGIDAVLITQGGDFIR
jgi:hypothetical protein